MHTRLKPIWCLLPALATVALLLTPADALAAPAATERDNTLTDAERRAGWLLLFDGQTHAGWMNSDRTAPRTPVQDGALNPHQAGHYMLVHTQQWSNFVLALDFKITKGCNSGLFMRTSSLTPRPGKDIGFNGLEIAIDDTAGAGYHDTGAIYDLVKPTKNAMKPVGEWNHIEITCDQHVIEVVLNGERVTRADLSQFTEPNKRPDGSAQIRRGLQGSPVARLHRPARPRKPVLVQEHQAAAVEVNR